MMNLLFIYLIFCFLYPSSSQDNSYGLCKTPEIPAGASLEPMKGVYDIGDIIKYKCSENSLIFGTTKRICLDSGEWSGEDPFCEKPSHLVATVAYTSSLGTKITTEVSDRNPISCSGNRSLMDRKSFWLASLEKDSQILAIRVLMSQGMAEVHVLDSVGTPITCEARNAVASKDNFKWKTFYCPPKNKARAIRINPLVKSTVVPQLCELEIFIKKEPIKMCGIPPIFSPGSKWEINDFLGHAQPGSEAVFSCNPNYRLEGDHTVIKCLPSGHWSPTAAKCIRITCATSVLDKVDGGQWIPVNEETENEMGTTKTLICNPGYEIRGVNQTVICTNNANWTDNTATCSRIEIVENVGKEKLEEVKVETITYVIGGFVIGCCILIIVLCMYRKCKIARREEQMMKKTSLYGLSTYEVHVDNSLYI